MKRIVVSAPGKIHLMGEHSVVYGKPALLAAINLRISVVLSEDSLFHVTSPESDDYIRHAVDVVTNALKKRIPKVHITVLSAVPSGFHIGSSASVAVAIVGAMYYYLTGELDLERINDLSYEVEKKIHGNPSGGDNTTVTYGGFVQYQKKSETEKVFQKLPLTISDTLDHFYLINTGRPKENTGEMVAKVMLNAKCQMLKYKKIFDRNEKQVKRIIEALKKSDEEMLIGAMKKGEQTLEDMGVVSEKVKPLIRDIEKNGGAAKILGGGGVSEGVGFLLCYHTDRKEVEHTSSHYHYSTQPITLGEEGVRIEHK